MAIRLIGVSEMKVLIEGIEFMVSYITPDDQYYEFVERPGELFKVTRCTLVKENNHDHSGSGNNCQDG